jgi:hypothetical protein
MYLAAPLRSKVSTRWLQITRAGSGVTIGDDRQEGRQEGRDDRRDCRQEEGRIGKDKRDCKQEKRDEGDDKEGKHT